MTKLIIKIAILTVSLAAIAALIVVLLKNKDDHCKRKNLPEFVHRISRSLQEYKNSRRNSTDKRTVERNNVCNTANKTDKCGVRELEDCQNERNRASNKHRVTKCAENILTEGSVCVLNEMRNSFVALFG